MTDLSQAEDSQLENFFHNRNTKTKEELKQLRERGKVTAALALNEENWAAVAVNINMKKAVMFTDEEKGNKEPPTTESFSNSKSSGVVGWSGFLSESKTKRVLSVQMEELSELKEKKLVQNTLQNSRSAYEKAAHMLFQPNDILLNLRSQNQKRAGNCLVTDVRLDDSDIESEIQCIVKMQTECLIDTVFSVPSRSKRKLHKEMLTKQKGMKAQFSQSLDGPLSEEFEGDSTEMNTKSKTKHRKKRIHKGSTLPHSGSHHKTRHALKQVLNKQHQLQDDTLDEISENESISSTATLKHFSSNAKSSTCDAITTTSSPLHASASTADEMMDEEEVRLTTEAQAEGDLFESQMAGKESSLKQKDGPMYHADEIPSHTESQVCSSLAELSSADNVNNLELCSVEHGEEREDSSSSALLSSRTFSHSMSNSYTSSSSFTTHSNRSSINITSFEEDCTSNVSEDVIVTDAGQSVEPTANNNEDELPVIPPVNSSGPIYSEDTAWSWLDRLGNPPPRRSVSLDSASSAGGSSIYQSSVQSPQISDSSFNTPDDPGFTPFVTSQVHPLSLEFDDDGERVVPRKWKGCRVPEKVWQDPGFVRFANGLDHEPSPDDVVVYKMIELSEVIESRFGKKLEQAIREAVLLAMKDQLSYMTFNKLCQRLMFQASEFKEQAVLITVLGRNLLEKLPNFQDKIVSFTSQAVEEFISVFLEISCPGEFSECRYDYDNWGAMTEVTEVRKMILTENAPFLDSIEDIPNVLLSSGEMKLPPFPPNAEDYVAFLMIPQSKIKKCQSVEVLFEEDIASSESNEATVEVTVEPQKTNITSKRYCPPRRTLSESQILEDDEAHRRGSDVSVFESIPEECEGSDVINARSRQEVWGHLKGLEDGESGSLSRPIVLSTSSTEPNGRPHVNSFLSRHSISSSTSLSSMSDSDSSLKRGVLTPPRKVSGIMPPAFEKVEEVTEIAEVCTISDGQIDEIRFSHITMIKKTQTTPEPHDKSHDNNTTESTDHDKGPEERHQSSTEMVADVIAPVLMLGLPVAVLTALAIGKT